MEEELWLPLVDEPIGAIVARIQAEDTQITSLITSPRRQLAFRTFAYIRVGLLLGQLLVETDLEPDESQTWVDQLLADPKHLKTIADEVRAVAHEVAADPKLSEDEPVGPDAAARDRFRAFARRSLSDQ
ncbi:MAG: hypothetical protein E6G67_08070 [Actinobacteria bacterium]|nr:MAG: hypothetical protein E6G67_08070 [Actinomycetota bacterium]